MRTRRGAFVSDVGCFIVAQSVAPGARMQSVNMHVFLRSRRSQEILRDHSQVSNEGSIKGSPGPFSPARPRLRDRAVSRPALLGQRTALAGAASAAGRPGPRERIADRTQRCRGYVHRDQQSAVRAQYLFLTCGIGFADAAAADPYSSLTLPGFIWFGQPGSPSSGCPLLQPSTWKSSPGQL